NWPAVKIALSVFPPFTLRMVGLGCGALLLLLLSGFQRKPLVPPVQSWRGVIIGGVLTIAVFNMSTALAQLSTSTSRAAVLTFTMPMMSAVLSWLIVGEQLDRRKLMALALGAFGVIVLAWPVFTSALAAHDQRAYNGLIFPLVAAFGWAAGTVYLKRWPVSGERITITAWQLLVGAACGAIGALIAGEQFPDHGISTRVAVALFVHIVPGTAMAYWLWFILSERVSATVASLTTLMVPVVGVLSAMLLVGDRPSPTDWCGFALVLGGAALIVLGPQLLGDLPPRTQR
ncbi:MAG: EamA family transporter, partial [Betaproteobacteria bacterium]